MTSVKRLFILRYNYAADVMTKRHLIRAKHLELVKSFCDRNKLLLGGALDPVEDGGFLVFNTETESEVEDFAQKDPYVVDEAHKVVESYSIHPWTVVAGSLKDKL